MLINWFTVFAQAINFLILVWLLKRFLYKPILQAIDEREKRIAAQLADAEAKKADAQKERDDFEHKNQVFDQERAALLKKAMDEASAERQRLLDEARRDADAFRAKRQEALRTEQRNLSRHNHSLGAKGGLCDRAKDAGGSRQHEPGGAHERGVHRPPARIGRRDQGEVGRRPRDREPRGTRAKRSSTCRRHSETRLKVWSRRVSAEQLKSSSRKRQSLSAGSNSPPMDRRWPGASPIISRRWPRLPPKFCT